MSESTKMIEQGGAFLAPADVGSAVHWFVKVTESVRKDGTTSSAQIDGEIRLSDCSRSIAWNLHDSYYNADGDVTQDPIEKIDAAIEQLQAARKAMVRGYRLVKKYQALITEQ